MRTFKIYCPTYFQIYDTVLLIIAAHNDAVFLVTVYFRFNMTSTVGIKWVMLIIFNKKYFKNYILGRFKWEKEAGKAGG